MPVYDYECSACQHAWELEQSIKDEPAKVCPRCAESHARRLIGGNTSFVLKGSRWARDGYQ